MTRAPRHWGETYALLLTFACTAAVAEEASQWPVVQGSGAAQQSAPATTPAPKSSEGMGGMQHGSMGGMDQGQGGMSGMQHGGMGGGMGGMSQGGQGGGMSGMQHGQMGGMGSGPSSQGGMGGMQHGGAGGGGMMGGGMMPPMSDKEKDELLMKAQELDLRLDQLRSRITQAPDEVERERLKAEHRAVLKDYLPKLHKLMMQAHMEMMKMPGGAQGQPMK